MIENSEYDDIEFGVDVREIRRRDGGPMRDVVRLHPNLETRMFPSWKSRCPIYTTLKLERQYVTVFEVDGAVESYRSQPLTLKFALDGQPVEYTPDFELRIAPWNVRVETKPKKLLLRNPQLAKKLLVVKRLYQSRGIPFWVLDKDRLPSSDWMESAAEISRLGKTEIDPLDEYRVLTALRRYGELPLGACAALVQSHAAPINGVLSIILRSRRIEAEMSGTVDETTLIRLRRLSSSPLLAARNHDS
ncbi:TnsA endonuclease N-terminal domain-containing protein [Bradyrhizobium barranii subsp. barranii]|uniref:TnsA endonuclease N-terminal domain-containing protein n=1 Tax=Bradyrhizobium barranii subsp. barranii TaxID=2823807 RepID=A0A939MG39_9BRAD|nr:TnsA endonuclease N-terminal domain-containing protein [Bradyrhizobium barranii]UEM10680.1 TnsA endonuclease N-terminal domain-containing protein [Bradyrhizobium barranii subsp. barranii]